MYCKKCKIKLLDNDKYCCNRESALANKNFPVNNADKSEKKDNKILPSIISIVLIVVILLANIITYPLSLNDTETSGMSWFFFVFIPSIPLFGISFALAFISVESFFADKKKAVIISKPRKILTIINIIQILLQSLVILLFLKP